MNADVGAYLQIELGAWAGSGLSGRCFRQVMSRAQEMRLPESLVGELAQLTDRLLRSAA
ncbi:MAG: hypothetical protein ABIP45_01875 [Knoellia sp.]